MARPKNTEACHSIESAACACFLEVGYAATTYDLIAQRAHIGRPLVQHYYPKKSMLAKNMFESLISQCAKQATEYAPSLFSGMEADGARFYLLGQGLFYYLTTRGPQLFLDILKSRELTNELIDLYPQWPALTSGTATRAEASSTEGNLAVALGGFFEIAYHTLSKNESLNVQEAFGNTVAMFLQTQGASRARALRVTGESALSAKDLESICSAITFE